MDTALLPSPLGPLYVEAEGGAITRLYTAGHRLHADAEPDYCGRFDDLAAQLDEYFNGSRTVFDLPLAPHGTEFEQRVWAALERIPYGQTRSYGELARELGSSARAVGRANGRNPISIVVPCHRVVGSDGTLTGYAGGLEAKAALLEHESGLFAGRLSEPPGVAS